MANEVTFTGQSGATWRYWTDQPLGTPGGFGGVYAGEGSDGTPMAVKVVKKERLSGVLDDRLLRREIDIGKRVADSGGEMLLPVIDAADANDALRLVMTRAEGALAAESIPMSEAEVVPVLVDIATGLQDLHSIGIIHRDLKPANVLRHGVRWKLADFGIARDQEIGTQDPTFVGWGSFPYMAPELWELKSPTVKTDLYALGCLGFELLAGATPYTGDQAALRKAHLTQTPPDVPCSNITLKNLISRLIAKDPANRPQDARAVLDRLRRAVLTRSPVQEAIARGLGAHDAEKSRAAAEAAAVKAADDARSQLIAQANADLREIFSDALEDLQAVEPDATLKERQRARPPGPIDRAPPGFDTEPGFTLSTSDATLRIDVWEDEPHSRVVDLLSFDWELEDALVRAGCAVITNRRYDRRLNAANLVYEQAGDRFAWQLYRFRAPTVPPSDYHYGPYGRTHGLGWKDFFDSRQAPGIPVWSETVAPLTADTALELFQEAVDLRPPDPRTGHW